MRFVLVVVALSLGSCGGVVVGTMRGTAPHQPTLDDVAWLVGTWETAVDEHGCTYREEWHRESAVLLGGRSRQVCSPERSPFSETLHLESRARGLVYVAWPTGQERTEFDLTSADADGLVVESPTHDFPTRIEYRRTEAGIDAIVSGPDRSFTLTMHAVTE